MIEQLPDNSREDVRLLLDACRVVRYKHNGEIVVYLGEDESIAAAAYDATIAGVQTFDETESEFAGRVLLELDTTDGEDESDTEEHK